MKHNLKLLPIIVLSFLVIFGNSAGATAASDTEKSNTAGTISIRDLNIPLPDSSWRSEFSSFLDGWMLYKEGCYDSSNSSMAMFFNEVSAEDSMIGSMDSSMSMGNPVIKEIVYDINGMVCPAYEQYEPKYDKTTVKVFCPVTSSRSLQVNVFVKKGSLLGIDPYSDEIKQMLQSLMETYHFNADADETVELDIQTIELNADGLDFEGKTYESEYFSVILPGGWEVFTTQFGSTYLIKEGTDQEDYGVKPSVNVHYYEKDAHTSYASNKLYYDDAVDMIVRICDIDCAAFECTEKMASKSKYWTYIKIYIAISDSECLGLSVNTESSEFEDVSITDNDIRQIIVSLKQSVSD